MDIHLNPDLDVEALSSAYGEKKRLQIKKVFPRDTALHIHDILARETPWQYTYFDGNGTAYMSIEELQRMPPRERASFAQGVARASQKGFGFSYNTFNFHHEIEKGRHLDHPLKAFDDFMNSEAFLGFVRQVTGDGDISSAGAAATWYGPGHYLNKHVDRLEGWDLRAAFIFYFCPTWKPDWGGELKFFPDKRGSFVEEAYFPAFNVLNLMTVPKYHSVGMVTPFAGAPRLAISGWLYAGEAPYSVDELP